MNFFKRLLTVLTATLILSFNSFAIEPDWSGYANILSTVSQGKKDGTDLVLVDYQTLKDNSKLEAVYRQLETFPVDRLTSREEKMAFYINIYNILALKMVLDHWPVDSIKDAGNIFRPVWDKPVGKINGKTISLGEIEHKILRPMGEPRIHFAIVCASISCPDLRNEPYTAAKLNDQLDNQAQGFLNNGDKGLKVGKKDITISKIFDWFEDDFDRSGGVETFIRRYRPYLPKLSIDTSMKYNWSLNEKQQ